MSKINIAFIPCDLQGKNIQKVVLATIVEARWKLEYDLRGWQWKIVVKSRFTTYWYWGGCYSGQALICVIPVAHIAFVVRESVAQHSDNSVQ